MFQIPQDDLAFVNLQFKPGHCRQKYLALLAYVNKIEEQKSVSKGAKNQDMQNITQQIKKSELYSKMRQTKANVNYRAQAQQVSLDHG